MRKLIVALALFGAFGAGELAAQVDETGTVTLEIPTVLYIDVPDPDIDFTGLTAADFASGSVAADNSVLLDYGSNVAHDLQLHLTGDLSAGGGLTKPAGDLGWSLDGSTFTPMTTTPFSIQSSGAGFTDDEQVFFNMGLSFTDEPGTYTGTITYTVVAQ